MATYAPTDARSEFRRQLRPFSSRSPISLSCIRCPATVPSNLEWKCGHCAFANRETNVYSFLNRCQSCEQEPSVFICPSCNALNFLDDTRDSTQPARKLIEVPKSPTHADSEIKRNDDHKAELAKLDREIAIERKKAELADIRAGEGKGEKSDHDKAVEELVARARKYLRLDFASPDARAILLKNFKDYPEADQRVDDVLKHLISEQDSLR